jgi:hypothetical protein
MLYCSRVTIATRDRDYGDEVGNVNECTLVICTILVPTRLTYFRCGIVYYFPTYPKIIDRFLTFF